MDLNLEGREFFEQFTREELIEFIDKKAIVDGDMKTYKFEFLKFNVDYLKSLARVSKSQALQDEIKEIEDYIDQNTINIFGLKYIKKN